jgi:hypothetical protein
MKEKTLIIFFLDRLEFLLKKLQNVCAWSFLFLLLSLSFLFSVLCVFSACMLDASFLVFLI